MNKKPERNWLTILGTVLFFTAWLNFMIFAIVAVSIGGDAISGKAINGHYFLSNHGRLTEVSSSVWQYSRIHTIIVWITHPIGIFGGVALTILGQRKAKGQIPSRFQTVIDNLKGSTLHSTTVGEIILPAPDTSSVVGGKAYMVLLANSSMSVFFPTRSDTETVWSGYLFSNGPKLTTGSTLPINISLTKTNSNSPITSLSLRIEDRLSVDWYTVSVFPSER